jgi:hypothetical protein
MAASLVAALGLLSLELAVDVPVYVGTSLPAPVVESALRETNRLFEEGGIRWEWRLSPSGSVTDAPATVVVLERPSDTVVSGCRRNLHDHRLGHTHLTARRITIWSEQVARALDGDWDAAEVPEVDEQALATAIGRVLAHELGHLFLRLNGHRARGLMRPSFSHRSLKGTSDRSFRLSGEDLDRVRAAIARIRASAEP